MQEQELKYCTDMSFCIMSLHSRYGANFNLHFSFRNSKYPFYFFFKISLHALYAITISNYAVKTNKCPFTK